MFYSQYVYELALHVYVRYMYASLDAGIGSTGSTRVRKYIRLLKVEVVTMTGGDGGSFHHVINIRDLNIIYIDLVKWSRPVGSSILLLFVTHSYLHSPYFFW